MRRRHRETANNQKEKEETSKRQWGAHRSSVSSHSSGDEVGVMVRVATLSHFMFCMADQEVYSLSWMYFNRGKSQLWLDSLLHLRCWRPQRLKPCPLTSGRILRPMDTPRLVTLVMPCQVNDNTKASQYETENSPCSFFYTHLTPLYLVCCGALYIIFYIILLCNIFPISSKRRCSSLNCH